MNFSASKQWIKRTRNQLNGVLSVLYELIHSHCKGASIMYSNHWPSYCALSFQLFSLQWGLLYKLKPILSLVLRIIFLLKSNSRQVSCWARFFFVYLLRFKWPKTALNSNLMFAVWFAQKFYNCITTQITMNLRVDECSFVNSLECRLSIGPDYFCLTQMWKALNCVT